MILILTAYLKLINFYIKFLNYQMENEDIVHAVKLLFLSPFFILDCLVFIDVNKALRKFVFESLTWIFSNRNFKTITMILKEDNVRVLKRFIDYFSIPGEKRYMFLFRTSYKNNCFQHLLIHKPLILLNHRTILLNILFTRKYKKYKKNNIIVIRELLLNKNFDFRAGDDLLFKECLRRKFKHLIPNFIERYEDENIDMITIDILNILMRMLDHNVNVLKKIFHNHYVNEEFVNILFKSLYLFHKIIEDDLNEEEMKICFIKNPDIFTKSLFQKMISFPSLHNFIIENLKVFNEDVKEFILGDDITTSQKSLFLKTCKRKNMISDILLQTIIEGGFDNLDVVSFINYDVIEYHQNDSLKIIFDSQYKFDEKYKEELILFLLKNHKYLEDLSKYVKLNNYHFKIYMENKAHHYYDRLLDFAKVMSCPLNKESIHFLFEHFDHDVFTFYHIRLLMDKKAINELTTLKNITYILLKINELERMQKHYIKNH